MKSLLVALIVHLMNDPASFMAGNVPFFVVPERMFVVDGGSPMKLATSNVFGPEETRKWKAAIAVSGSVKNAAELCYQSVYGDFKRGLKAVDEQERAELLTEVGGHHAMARVAVAWCNVSIKKLDILPLIKHPEFAAAEMSLRTAGYKDDVAYIEACPNEECKAKAMASFARGMVGVPLEATR